MPRIARIVAPGLPHHVTQRDNRRMQTFFRDEDYQEYLTLLAHWREHLLERRFAKTMRRSIAEEITRLRLERAKRHLVESDEALKNVAWASGFSDINHLYRAFIRLEGLSPTEYRKQRRQES